jgi:hypothetical protein
VATTTSLRTATTLQRVVPFGRIEFEQRDAEPGQRAYRAYHIVDDAGKRTRCVSVTTFLDVLAKRALYRWNEEQGILAALSLERGGRLKDVDIHQATAVIRDNGWGAEAALKVAAKRGVGIHEPFERYWRDGVVPNPADFPPEHRGYIRGLVRWILSIERRGSVEMEDSEFLVADPKLKLAGRADLRLKIAGLPYIVDLKTNKYGTVWPEHPLQTVAYAHCDEQCGRDPVMGCLVVAVGPEGTYEEMPSLASVADFKAVLDVYRRMGKLHSAIEAERGRQKARAAA